MNVDIVHGWNDYELIDTGNGKRLERFGPYVLVRPDPEILWQPGMDTEKGGWKKPDAAFTVSGKSGYWKKNAPVAASWELKYRELTFTCRLTPFKHTGIFPEHRNQWDFIMDSVENASKPVSILNLFGYTGGATVAAASRGAVVTHVDASKPAVAWASDNLRTSGFGGSAVRWIVEDVVKFVEREVRRGHTYDGIIMDPPVYGHGPDGQIWDFQKGIVPLMQNIARILSGHPLWVIINAYAVSVSPISLSQALQGCMPKGIMDFGELAIAQKDSPRIVSTGKYAIWKRE